MVVLPSLLFNVQEFMPFREFTWPLASTGPLGIHALITTFSATHLARLQGLKESVQSIQEHQKVIKMLQARFDGPFEHPQTDGETISAILAIASTEVCSSIIPFNNSFNSDSHKPAEPVWLS
jgi:hypothetical protein